MLVLRGELFFHELRKFLQIQRTVLVLVKLVEEQLDIFIAQVHLEHDLHEAVELPKTQYSVAVAISFMELRQQLLVRQVLGDFLPLVHKVAAVVECPYKLAVVDIAASVWVEVPV